MHKLKKSVVSALALTMLAGSITPVMTFASETGAIYDANGYGEESAVISGFKVSKMKNNSIKMEVSGQNIDVEKVGYAVYKDGGDITGSVNELFRLDGNSVSIGVNTADGIENQAGTYRFVLKYAGKVVKKDSKTQAYLVAVDTSKPSGERITITEDKSGEDVPSDNNQGTEQNGNGEQTPGTENGQNTGSGQETGNTGNGQNAGNTGGSQSGGNSGTTTGNSDLDGLKPIGGSTGEQTLTPGDIYNIENKTFDISENGGPKEITVYVNSKVENEKMGVKVTKNGQVDSSVTSSISGAKGKRTVTLNIPANTSEQPVKYEVVFSPDKNKVAYNESQKVTINQKAAENSAGTEAANYTIKSFSAKTPNMSAKGGQNSITVKGTDLPENMYIKIFKGSEDVTASVNSGKEKIEMMGVETVKTGYVTLPASTSEKDVYTAKLFVGNKVVKTAEITVSNEGTEKPEVAFIPSRVYQSGDNEITIEALAPVFEITKGGLKNGISLDLEGTGKFVPLSENDKVEIDGNKIKITMPEYTGDQLANKLNSFATVKINRSVLRNEAGNPLMESTSLIAPKTAVIDHVDFVSGKVLDSKGGNVELKITGTSLKNSIPGKTIVEVVKNGRIENQTKVSGVVVEGSGKEQTIKFKLPENSGDVTESYTVRISLDGGRTFNSKADSNIDDKANLLVASVLPKDAKADTPTLSFMSIQSYGTSGGGDKIPDNTHTETPVGQGSKKTYVTVYGTNLDKNKTKVRIIDKNGVVWHPVHDAAQGNFSMVGFDGTGITGNGNVQMLEIIAPSRYKKTIKPVLDAQGNPVLDESGKPKMESVENTYTYEIAVDGVHFNDKITVSATILDDGAAGKKTLDEVLRHVNVKYQTKDGKDIKDSMEIKLNADMPINITDAVPQEIEGYKYVGMKGFEQTQEVKDAVNKYNALKEKKNPTAEEVKEMETLKKLVDGHRFDELDQKVGDRKEIVYLYEAEKTETPGETGTTGGTETTGTPSTGSSSSGSSRRHHSSSSKETAVNSKPRAVERTSGNDRYATSIEISRKAFKHSDKVILVSGENFADALTAAALTKGETAPVLLVNDKNIESVSKEMSRLGAKEAVVVGGQALSEENAAKLNKNAKVSVDNIFGKDRYETSVKTAEKVISKFGNKGKVILVDGRNYPDAVSIAPYAAKEGIPVILVNGGKMTESAKQLLKKYNINEAVVIGGENSVGKSVEGMFSKVERIAGSNRYETSKKIAETYFPNATKAFVATGENYADALSSGYYAAMNNAPVILTKSNKLDASTKAYFDKNSNQKIEIIGGENSVNSNLFK